MGSPPPACKVNITQWKGFCERLTQSNQGKALQEDSKAVCAVAGTPCISISWHGQICELSVQNFKKLNKEIHSQINPLVDIREITGEADQIVTENHLISDTEEES
jgi:hypothetical protein